MSDAEFKTTLMEFPCEFTIKVIGVQSPGFKDSIIAIAAKHDPLFKSDTVRETLSKEQRYCALNLLIHATSQPHLDALYHELTAHPDTHMVL
jgi:putative lipoic acid-binding regulatory protein